MKHDQGSLSMQEWQQGLVSGRLVVRVDESVLASNQGDRSVLLDYAHGEYYGLNAVATSVWGLLCAGRSFAEIVDSIVRSYDVSADAATHDIAGLLADLVQQGVVRVHESAE